MAVLLAVDNEAYDALVATYTGDASAGNGSGVDLNGYPHRSVQRVSGTGTYTVEGSNDGATWGALPTAIAAVNDNLVKEITGKSRFVRVVTATAAATVIVVGSK